MKRVLFVGQCFYNTWYLSRELRKLSWQADVLNTDPDNRYDYLYHGEDFRLQYEQAGISGEYWWNTLNHLGFLLTSLQRYDVFHFTGINMLSFSGCLKSLPMVIQTSPNVKIEKFLSFFVRFLIRRYGHSKALAVALKYANIGSVHTIEEVLRHFGLETLNEGWEPELLRLHGKKIVYTLTGCIDGVSQTAFSAWEGEKPCEDCIWRDRPDVCSDEKNLRWGEYRNQWADFQVNLGGNNADYNKSLLIHEVPEFYCLDPGVWNPELLIPTNYRLFFPPDTVKIYHAVGDFDARSKNNKNIKSTHIILDIIRQLQQEGYPVELIFFKNIPNKEVRYYQAQADIVIDMLKFGWFGANVREALMLGKPTVCYIRPEWLKEMRREIPDYVDELPVISATPNTVYEVLKDLVLDKQKRLKIGAESREFAVKWHSSEAGAKRMDQIYNQLVSGEKER